MFVEMKERGEITEAPAKALDEASQILLKAADFIERNGLSCGGGTDMRGRECVAVVINNVSKGRPAHWQAANRMEAALDFQFDEGMHLRPLAQWSDAQGRAGRTAEVVAKLREVALS